VAEAVERAVGVAELAPREVPFEEPSLQVAWILVQELVAKVVGKPPTPLRKCAKNLLSESAHERVLLLGSLFSTNDLAKNGGYH